MSQSSIHGHTLLHHIQNHGPIPLDRLTLWVQSEFGSNARFHACFASDMDLSSLLDALQKRGKIRATAEGLVFGENATICADE